MKNANLLFAALFLLAGAGADVTLAQEPPKPAAKPPIPGQLARDFVAGRVPREEEIQAAEKDVAADPNNLALVRRLGKAYFFKFFGSGNVPSIAKAQATFDRALAITPDDPETLAYYGALHTYVALRVDKNDPAKQKGGFDKGFELLQRAEKIAPRDGAVISVTAGSYIELPDSYGMSPHVIEQLENMRRGMGPMFDRFSHHGRQRLLLTLGRAYARMGNVEKARANFDEALAINQESTEAGLLRTELGKLNARN